MKSQIFLSVLIFNNKNAKRKETIMSVLATISTGSNSVTVDVASTLIPSDTEASDINVVAMTNSPSVGYMSSSDYSDFDSSQLSSQKPSVNYFKSSGTPGTASYVRAASFTVTNVQASSTSGKTTLTISLPTGMVAAPYFGIHTMSIARVELSSGAAGDPIINTFDGKSYRL